MQAKTQAKTPPTPLQLSLALHLGVLFLFILSSLFFTPQKQRPIEPIKVTLHQSPPKEFLKTPSPPKKLAKAPPAPAASKTPKRPALEDLDRSKKQVQKSDKKVKEIEDRSLQKDSSPSSRDQTVTKKEPENSQAKASPKSPSKPLAKKPPISSKVGQEVKKVHQMLEEAQELLRQQKSPLQGDLQVAKEQTSEQIVPSKGSYLVAILQSWLTLPEYGEVEILLELAFDGSVKELTILNTQSERNAAYIKEQLSFSRLPLTFEKDEPRTFVLTLSDAFF